MAINVKDKLVTLESLGVAYSAEQDAREEADQALSTRIDNIVAPEGDPSLTEVSDARVSGSTTYNTLKARLDADKAAVGTEISAINESLGDVRADLEDLDERVEVLESGGGGSGLTPSVKNALLACFDNVAWKDTNGQTYYDDLYDALYPPADLVSISAVYTQSGTVYNTDTLNSLKSDLVVTANYSDSSTQTVTNYTLSGTLTVGTSTITVSYGGKTTTFTVTVTEAEIYSYSYANGDLIKLVASCSYVEGVGAYYTDSTDNKRRTFLSSSGENTLLFKDSQGNYVDGEYYPIPIPSDATSVTVSITPNLNNIGVGFYTYDETAGTYTRVYDQGWTPGSYTNTFTAGEYDAITVTAKTRFSVAFTESDEPTELTITFSR